ncbi:MAG TPA: hypothetical protein VIJ12_02325 [Candidatus Baltobacteraceae bacterium]
MTNNLWRNATAIALLLFALAACAHHGKYFKSEVDVSHISPAPMPPYTTYPIDAAFERDGPRLTFAQLS